MEKVGGDPAILRKTKRTSNLSKALCLLLSGWQDSNLRPPAPKAGAITGLRYTPKMIIAIQYFKSQNPKNDYCSVARFRAEFIPCLTRYYTPKMIIAIQYFKSQNPKNDYCSVAWFRAEPVLSWTKGIARNP